MTPRAGSIRRGSALGLVLAAVTGLATLGVGLASRGRQPPHPSSWDPRVREVVRFVETAKGRPFRHPVTVSFLADSAFLGRLRQDDQPSAQDRADNAWRSASLRALGLAQGEFDLLASTRAALGRGVFGFYDPDADQMMIRGDQLTATARSTLAHELTHAWQDQWYGLNRHFASSEEQAGWTALVEGDATYVGELYSAVALSAAEQAASAAVTANVTDQYKDLPPVIIASLGFPYQFGLTYVIGRRATTDFLAVKPTAATVTALDRAFANPPESSKAVLEGGESSKPVPPIQVRPVAIPRLQAGEQWLDTDTLGAYALFLAVDQRLGYARARPLLDAWATDSLLVYRRGTTVCTRAHIRAGADRGGAILQSTMQAWAKGINTRSVSFNGRRDVMVQSCDPGPKVTAAAAPDTLDGSTLLNVEQLLAQRGNTVPGAGANVTAAARKAIICALSTKPRDVEGLLSPAVAAMAQLVRQTGPLTCPPAGP